MSSIKKNLYRRCLENVVQRITSIQTAIESTQAASHEDTKSSAGDKYETGRAMAHLEVEKLDMQLTEALKSRAILEHMAPEKENTHVQMGSMVMTDSGNFFIAVSAGPFQEGGKDFFCVSSGSPIGSALIGKKAGDNFRFRDREGIILQVL